jgi:hypothetical protein
MKRNIQFSMLLAPGWEDATVFSYLGPDFRGRRDVVTVAVDPSVTALLSQYAEERLPIQMASIPEPELIQQEERSLDDGRRVYEATVRSSAGEKSMFYFITYLIESGKGYTFMAQAAKHSMKATRGAMRQMVASFQA